MKFGLTYAKRLLQVADAIENDGKAFDYDNPCKCALPRAEKLIKGFIARLEWNYSDSYYTRGLKKLFCINSQEANYLFNLDRNAGRLDRYEVANRFRTFVHKKLGVVRPKVAKQVDTCPLCEGSGKLTIIEEVGVICRK